MFIRAAAQAETALVYAVATSPSPLQITPADTTATPATISVTAASPGSAPVRVASVKFTLAEGPGAGDLTEHLDQVHTTVTPAGDWTFTRGDDNTFVAVPAGDRDYVEVTDKGLLFELSNIAVNAEIGVTTLDILERTQDEDGDTVKGRATFHLGKCFPAFRFGDLRPTILDDGRTSFANGENVTLTWNASHGAAYTMLCDNQSYDVTNVRTWTTPQPVHRDTAFHLRASLTTDGHTVTHYLHTDVTVDKPDLEAGTLTTDGSLTANGPLTAKGSLDVDGLLTANADIDVWYRSTDEHKFTTTGQVDSAKFPGGLTVDQGVTMNGDVTVNGLLAAQHDFTIAYDGQAKVTTSGISGLQVLGDTSLQGLTVAGDANVQALTANGELRANGLLSSYGPTTLFGFTAYPKHSGYLGGSGGQWTYTAPTDGFIVASVTSLTAEADPNVRENSAYWQINVNVSTGVSYGTAVPQGYYDQGAGPSNSLTAPVPYGQTVTVTIEDPKCGNGSGYATIYWLPIGGSQDLS
ncbi:hypothetical protein [Streptomyces sp. NPDC093707]|uniref:hypothetical protein n=1 Tax=Streptomyces sp. NPDC093707 TaxID=3154984 RepID=UPI00344F1B3F